MIRKDMPCGKCGGDVVLFNQGRQVTKNESRAVVECSRCQTHWGEVIQRFHIGKPPEERQELERRRKAPPKVVEQQPTLTSIDGDRCHGKTAYGKACPNNHLPDSIYCGKHLFYKTKLDRKHS